jgi:uncharacterized protein
MELRYKIKEIPDEGLVVDQAIPTDLLKDALEGLEPDLSQCSGSIHLTLTRARHDVVVSGRVSAALSVACGACLKPAALTVRVPIQVVYAEGDEEDEDEVEDLDAEDVIHYDGDVIDLRPMLREQLILSLPMSVRCKEGCKGLCTVCGGDRNLTDCGHKVEVTQEEDPRFAALKSLKLEQ